MYRIEVAESAEKDMQDAVKYIAQELQNPSAALTLWQDADKAMASLVEMPQRHMPVKDVFLANQDIRCLPVGNYLLFYVLCEDEKTVNIVRFIYNKRDWKNLLPEE